MNNKNLLKVTMLTFLFFVQSLMGSGVRWIKNSNGTHSSIETCSDSNQEITKHYNKNSELVTKITVDNNCNTKTIERYNSSGQLIERTVETQRDFNDRKYFDAITELLEAGRLAEEKK